MIDGWGISREIAPIWMSPDFTDDDQSTLVQLMAWCHQATSHYLGKCWPRYLLPYGVTRPQWVKHNSISNKHFISTSHSECFTTKHFHTFCPVRTHQECLIELEGTGELSQELVDAVQELQEHRAPLISVLGVDTQGTTVRKLVTKLKPLPLHQHLETLQERQNDGLVQGRCNSIANTLELHLSC